MSDKELDALAEALSIIKGQHAAPYPADYRGAAAALLAGLSIPAGASCYLANIGQLALATAFFCLSTVMGLFLTWTILPRKA